MKKIIQTKSAPNPVGPYNQAVDFNGVLYTAGQIAIDPKSGSINNATIEEETEQVMKNLQAILTEAGYSFENVVKCSVFVSDMKMYDRINSVYGTYFDHATAPARELVEVANLPKFVNVEISAIAHK